MVLELSPVKTSTLKQTEAISSLPPPSGWTNTRARPVSLVCGVAELTGRSGLLWTIIIRVGWSTWKPKTCFFLVHRFQGLGQGPLRTCGERERERARERNKNSNPLLTLMRERTGSRPRSEGSP